MTSRKRAVKQARPRYHVQRWDHAFGGFVDGWSDFYVAQAGASAALAGLLFVAISISLSDMLSFPHLPMRAASALALLTTVLFVSALMLIPDQSIERAGGELIALAVIATSVIFAMGRESLLKAPPEFRRNVRLSAAVKAAAMLLFIASGILMVATGEHGPGFSLRPASLPIFVR